MKNKPYRIIYEDSFNFGIDALAYLERSIAYFSTLQEAEAFAFAPRGQGGLNGNMGWLEVDAGNGWKNDYIENQGTSNNRSTE